MILRYRDRLEAKTFLNNMVDQNFVFFCKNISDKNISFIDFVFPNFEFQTVLIPPDHILLKYFVSSKVAKNVSQCSE